MVKPNQMAIADDFVHQDLVYLGAPALLVVLVNILLVAQIPVMIALLALLLVNQH